MIAGSHGAMGTAAIPFRTDHPGLVLGPGPAGRCDDRRVGGAVVERDGSGQWRMWYYCRDAAYARPAPATLGSGRIALAVSQDGVAWRRIDGSDEAGAVLAPASDPAAFDHGHVGLTDVVRDADGWSMFTFGGGPGIVRTGLPALGDVPGLAMRCGLAWSNDGFRWRRVAGHGPGGALFDILPDEIYAAWPNAVSLRGRMLLQYTAPTRDMAAFRTRVVALATDRRVERLGDLVWLDGPMAHDSGGIVTRHVIPDPLDGAGWLMAYTALDRDHRRTIALARSDDGLTWRHAGGPVLRPGAPGAWDDFGVAANRLVVVATRLHLYYYGFRSLTAPDGPRGIGLAVAPVADERAFRRVGS